MNIETSGLFRLGSPAKRARTTSSTDSRPTRRAAGAALNTLLNSAAPPLRTPQPVLQGSASLTPLSLVHNEGSSRSSVPRDNAYRPPVPPRLSQRVDADEDSDWGSDFDDVPEYTAEEMAYFAARDKIEDIQIREFNRQFPPPPPPPRRTRPAP